MKDEIMTLTPIYVFVIASVVLVILWMIPRTRHKTEKAGQLLSLLASVAAMTVFVELYWTVDQQKQARAKEQERESAESYARLSTLYSELAGDIQVCERIHRDRTNHLAAVTVPDNFFTFNSIEDILRTGRIRNHSIRNQIRNAYHRMLWANRVMENSVGLFYLQTLVGPQQQALINTRISNAMGMLMGGTEEIRVMLEGVEPLLMFYMENEDTFSNKALQDMNLDQLKEYIQKHPTRASSVRGDPRR